MARYFEPFVGSGAVFFDLCASRRLDPSDARLSDENADLVGMYLRVRDATEELIDRLTTLARRHAREGRAHYYRIRDEHFNPERRRWLQGGGSPSTYPTGLAAMLLYLNRTGYNGLFRLNAGGDFNVPAGRYDSPQIVNADRLRAAAAVLAHAEIARTHFTASLQLPGEGDLVYLDPPYAPLTRTANFRSYTAAGFSDADQRQLRDDVLRLAERGAFVVLSNSTAPAVVKLYEDPAVRKAGLRCHRVKARRAINTDATRRGLVEELVVSNVEPLNAS